MEKSRDDLVVLWDVNMPERMEFRRKILEKVEIKGRIDKIDGPLGTRASDEDIFRFLNEFAQKNGVIVIFLTRDVAFKESAGASNDCQAFPSVYLIVLQEYKDTFPEVLNACNMLTDTLCQIVNKILRHILFVNPILE